MKKLKNMEKKMDRDNILNFTMTSLTTLNQAAAAL